MIVFKCCATGFLNVWHAHIWGICFLITAVIVKAYEKTKLFRLYRSGVETRNGTNPGCVNSAVLYRCIMTKHQVHITCYLASGHILYWFSKVAVSWHLIRKGISLFCHSVNCAYAVILIMYWRPLYHLRAKWTKDNKLRFDAKLNFLRKSMTSFFRHCILTFWVIDCVQWLKGNRIPLVCIYNLTFPLAESHYFDIALSVPLPFMEAYLSFMLYSMFWVISTWSRNRVGYVPSWFS